MFAHLTKLLIHANYCWLQTQCNYNTCINYVHSFGIKLALLFFCSALALMDETPSFENFIKLFLSLCQIEIFSCWGSTLALVTIMNQLYKLDESGLTFTSKNPNSALTRSCSICHGLTSDQPLHHWPALWILSPLILSGRTGSKWQDLKQNKKRLECKSLAEWWRGGGCHIENSGGCARFRIGGCGSISFIMKFYWSTYSNTFKIVKTLHICGILYCRVMI